MSADSVDPAVVHNKDPVAVFHAGDPLRDDQLGSVRDLFDESLADLCVGSRVDSACAVVKDEDLRLFQERSRDTQPLLLTARYVRAALLDPGVVSFRHLLYEFIGTGHFAGPYAVFFRGVFIAPAEIIKNGPAEKDVLLQYYGDLVSEYFQIVVTHVDPSDKYSALGHIVQTADQIDQRGLGTAGSADDTDPLTGADPEIDVLEDGITGAGTV